MNIFIQLIFFVTYFYAIVKYFCPKMYVKCEILLFAV